MTARFSTAQPRATKRRRLLLCAAALWPLLTAFSLPQSGIEGLGTKLDDTELSEMRGKFIRADSVSYFGLQLQSSWQGGDGVTTYATLLFKVDFASPGGGLTAGNPVMMIGWNRDCNDCGDAAMDVVGFGPAAQGDYVAVTGAGTMPVGGLASFQGAVQSQSIAGSDNAVRNDMRIAVVPAATITGGNDSGLQPATGTTSEQFADGDTVSFILDRNNLALSMTANGGSDAVRQGVDGNLNQAAQNVLLSSNFNDVRNSIGITIGLADLQKADRLRVDNALSAMRGRGF